MVSPFFTNHLNPNDMGQMKKIYALIQDGDTDKLRRAIKLAEANNHNHVFFLGRQYSLSDAYQIAIFIDHEKREHDKISGNQQSTQ